MAKCKTKAMCAPHPPLWRYSLSNWQLHHDIFFKWLLLEIIKQKWKQGWLIFSALMFVWDLGSELCLWPWVDIVHFILPNDEYKEKIPYCLLPSCLLLLLSYVHDCFVWMYVCLFTTWVPGVQGGQKVDSLELELQPRAPMGMLEKQPVHCWCRPSGPPPPCCLLAAGSCCEALAGLDLTT